MTDYFNCTNQQPPTYSGVTINITNPAMNIPPQYPPLPPEVFYNSYNQQQNPYYNAQIAAPGNSQYINRGEFLEPIGQTNSNYNSSRNTSESVSKEMVMSQADGISSYPQQYYINSYAQNPEQTSPSEGAIAPNQTLNVKVEQGDNPNGNMDSVNGYTSPYIYPGTNPQSKDDSQNNIQSPISNEKTDGITPIDNGNSNVETDSSSNLETSKEIIQELDERNAEEKELEKNGKKTKIISLTNEYIMSLENYLNNPNTDIRLMAAKEILTRLDEDRNRYDDAALNALLNKMLQDPNKLIRIAALSAFSSDLASGNDFTVQLLTQIQQNPEADPEDVLEASQILLKRTAITEVRYIPVPDQQNNGET